MPNLQDLKALDLHEVVAIENSLDVIRVPKGWLYVVKVVSANGTDMVSTCFVPEFL